MSRFDLARAGVDAAELISTLKIQCECIEHTLARVKDGHSKTLALTKLEEVFMWATRAVKDEQGSKM